MLALTSATITARTRPMRLQVAAQRRVEQQRQKAPGQTPSGTASPRAPPPAATPNRRRRARHDESGTGVSSDGEQQAEIEAVHQRAARVLYAPGAVGARDQEIEPEQHADAEDGDGEERVVPMLTAPSASALRRPTIIVSTSPIAIQPSSAVATGQASLNIGRSSTRRPARIASRRADIGPGTIPPPRCQRHAAPHSEIQRRDAETPRARRKHGASAPLRLCVDVFRDSRR